MHTPLNHILYVDDEVSLLDIGKLYLERTKEFKVDTVQSVLEAFDLLGNTNYDAVVSDYDMPERDGIAFLKRISFIRKRYSVYHFYREGEGRDRH